MTGINSKFIVDAKSYIKKLNNSFNEKILLDIQQLSQDLLKLWISDKQVFICGNGGSAANALHMANDLHYGIGACGPEPKINGIKVEALSANSGVITCLANDTGYENIYSQQLEVKGQTGDILIVLSGSGNSANVINALKKAAQIGMKSYAILGFSGGECLQLANHPIHFAVDDMQIAEDAQLIVGHLCMQWLSTHKPRNLGD